MSPDDVRERIETIKAMAGDPEAAHGSEDLMYEDLLRSIAEGSCADPAECARIALHSADIEFERWYA